jgi:hypothetical protein
MEIFSLGFAVASRSVEVLKYPFATLLSSGGYSTTLSEWMLNTQNSKHSVVNGSMTWRRHGCFGSQEAKTKCNNAKCQ